MTAFEPACLWGASEERKDTPARKPSFPARRLAPRSVRTLCRKREQNSRYDCIKLTVQHPENKPVPTTSQVFGRCIRVKRINGIPTRIAAPFGRFLPRTAPLRLSQDPAPNSHLGTDPQDLVHSFNVHRPVVCR